MLAEGCASVPSVRAKLGDDLMVEVKYDGERLQVHATASEGGGVTLRAYKRGGRECSYDLRVAGSLAHLYAALGHAPPAEARTPPPLAAALQAQKCRCGCGAAVGACPRPPVRSIVLDGELLIYNETLCGGDGGIEPFGAVQHLVHSDRGGARHNSTLGGRRRHLFIFFDVLHLDGRDLTPLPLHARVAAMRGALREIDTFVVTSRARRMAYDEGALTAAFARSRAERYEGLVVKAAASPYVPNERRHWCKLKHDRIPGLGDTVTLAIVGARLGDGGALGELCLGCRDGDGSGGADGGGPRFAWLCNVGRAHGGLSESLWQHLDGALLGVGPRRAPRPLLVPLRRGCAPPPWLRHASAKEAMRPHAVLASAAEALLTDCLGSQFLPADASDTSSAASAWMLRFPRMRALRPPTEPLERCVSAEQFDAAARRSCAPEDDDERRRIAAALGPPRAARTSLPRSAARGRRRRRRRLFSRRRRPRRRLHLRRRRRLLLLLRRRLRRHRLPRIRRRRQRTTGRRRRRSRRRRPPRARRRTRRSLRCPAPLRARRRRPRWRRRPSLPSHRSRAGVPRRGASASAERRAHGTGRRTPAARSGLGRE